MKRKWNDGWHFVKTAVGVSAETVDVYEYTAVDLPHDWLIHDAEHLYEPSFGFYRKTWCHGGAGRTRIYFEGVYQDCTVYINGIAAGENKYGYSSFEVDVTAYLHSGENEILVLVRHESPNSRWYSGAGIFRDVWLIETGTDCLVSDGVYFSAKKQGTQWVCTVSAEMLGTGAVTASLCTKDGRTLYEGECGSFTIVDAPELVWDTETPNLLTLTVTMRRDGERVDSITQSVGLRELRFDPDHGLFLNGRHIKLHGVCLHHDLGALGAAFRKEAARRQLLSMKEMGANAVRTSHNMPAVGFMELCDELGILVDSEAFDMWERPKTEYDYARFFTDWFERDVASWVRRDRNHPSVIMWSVGNEIYDTHLSARGCEVSKMLHDAVRKHDPFCNAYTTIGSNYMPWENAQHCAEQVDLVGYNYGENCYAKHHAEHPHWCIYGSETTAGVKSRGIYHFPLETAFLTHDDLQCSSLGNCRGGFTADTAQGILCKDLETAFCAGMFIWTGSDYIGEPSPYSTKNAYYGSIDTAGLKKDIFWLYQAAWTDQPVLHLFPYWDFNEGQLVDVVTFTNLSEVELFVNGESVGRRIPQQYVAAWQVPYVPGEIRVQGYDENGQLHEDIRRSFGDSAAIVLTPNRSVLRADGEDMIAVEISAVDGLGNPVENARDRVCVTVEGARLVGFDNGDSTDYDSYHSGCRKLFSGKAVVWIAATDKSGTTVVRAEAPGLQSAELKIPVRASDVADGAAFSRHIAAEPHSGEIPVRKIELRRNTGSLLTPEQPYVTVTANILPANASCTDLAWKVVTNSGIESKLAHIAVDGDTVTLTAVGDGAFRLRCTCNNGKPQPEIISDFEFTAEGFGQPFTDPYAFVTGCFCNVHSGIMNEVAEGGVTLTDTQNTIGFTKVDFGKYGSDLLTVKLLHWFSEKDVDFTLWDGSPDENGVLLGEFTYHATFLWQTYKENSYRLSAPLCGEHDLFFRFGAHTHRLDFGGFRFVPKQKAYETLAAADCDLIHGDTYTVSGSCVTGIGNNVFMDFEQMDFTRGIAAIELTGRTRHDNDSVHVYITGEDNEVRQIIEFPFSQEYTAIRQAVPDFRGRAMVKFCFLPGCDFDFASFRCIPRDEAVDA